MDITELKSYCEHLNFVNKNRFVVAITCASGEGRLKVLNRGMERGHGLQKKLYYG